MEKWVIYTLNFSKSIETQNAKKEHKNNRYITCILTIGFIIYTMNMLIYSVKRHFYLIN